jgi:hypothetical protein
VPQVQTCRREVRLSDQPATVHSITTCSTKQLHYTAGPNPFSYCQLYSYRTLSHVHSRCRRQTLWLSSLQAQTRHKPTFQTGSLGIPIIGRESMPKLLTEYLNANIQIPTVKLSFSQRCGFRCGNCYNDSRNRRNHLGKEARTCSEILPRSTYNQA